MSWGSFCFVFDKKKSNSPKKKACGHFCSKKCHSGVCETSVCIKLIPVTCGCREKKGEKLPCNVVIELRKSKHLAKDSSAVLDCDAVCEEKKKERALQKKKEEEAEEEMARANRLAKRKGGNSNVGKTTRVKEEEKNQFEWFLYLGAALVSFLVLLLFWHSRKYAI